MTTTPPSHPATTRDTCPLLTKVCLLADAAFVQTSATAQRRYFYTRTVHCLYAPINTHMFNTNLFVQRVRRLGIAADFQTYVYNELLTLGYITPCIL